MSYYFRLKKFTLNTSIRNLMWIKLIILTIFYCNFLKVVTISDDISAMTDTFFRFMFRLADFSKPC